MPANTSFSRQKGKAAFVKKVLELAARNKPTLAVAGHIGMAPVAWLLLKMGLVRSYLIVLHGIEAWRRVDRLDRIASKGANLVISTTNYTAEEFAKCNQVDRDRIRVVPLGLAENEVAPITPLSSAGKQLRVLTVGRLWSVERYKGMDTLIQAAAQCQRAGVHIDLTVVGSGDDLPRLKYLAQSLNVTGNVKFPGSVPDDVLQSCYSGCDVFAMPSRSEGFGIVFLEAMRWGKVCIGGDHGGTCEVIDNGVDGFLVEHGNVERLAEHLQVLAHTPELRRRMGENGRQKVATRFLYHHLEQRWRAVLDEVLQSES